MRDGPLPRPSRRATVLRAAFVPTVLVLLLAGIAGGLVRAGVGAPADAGSWLAPAVSAHAFL